MPDAVVIGAGPNGLVAANLLADAGWSVEVLEAQPEPGGAVRSDRGVHPDYVSDLFSAFYPLAAASPVLARLDLAAEGLRWSHAPSVLAHPLKDGSCAVLERRVEETSAGLAGFAAADGDAWRDMFKVWSQVGPDLVGALFTPFPPVRPPACGETAGCRWTPAGQEPRPAGASSRRGGVRRRRRPALAGRERPACRPGPRGCG